MFLITIALYLRDLAEPEACASRLPTNAPATGRNQVICGVSEIWDRS